MPDRYENRLFRSITNGEVLKKNIYLAALDNIDFLISPLGQPFFEAQFKGFSYLCGYNIGQCYVNDGLIISLIKEL